jgi:hypothetical protein
LDEQHKNTKTNTRFNRIKSETEKVADNISKSIDKQERNDKRLKNFRRRKILSIAKTKSTHRRNKSVDTSNFSNSKSPNTLINLSKTTHEIAIPDRGNVSSIGKLGHRSRKQSIYFESTSS